jgi:hypothetical protein
MKLYHYFFSRNPADPSFNSTYEIGDGHGEFILGPTSITDKVRRVLRKNGYEVPQELKGPQTRKYTVTLVLKGQLTEASKQLFLAYATDAGNWSGQPMIGGNIPATPEARGNITDLKRKGFITTFRDRGSDFIVFTEKGKSLAATHGVLIC